MIINCQIRKKLVGDGDFSGSSTSFLLIHDCKLASPNLFFLKLTLTFRIIETVYMIMEIFFPDFVNNILHRVRIEIYSNNKFKETLLS